MDLITLEYNPKCTLAISDGNVEEYFLDILNAITIGQKRYIAVGNESLFTRVILGIVRGEVKHTDFVVLFGGKKYYYDEYGRLENMPGSFCSYNVDMSELILHTMLEKFK